MNNPRRQPGAKCHSGFDSSEGAEYTSARTINIKPLQGFRSVSWSPPGWRRGLFIFSHFVAQNVKNKTDFKVLLIELSRCV
jgi:hypothetical protein